MSGETGQPDSEFNRENTLAQAATRFLAGLPPEQRSEYQQELNRFVRWYGSERPAGGLAAREMEDYARGIEGSQANTTKRLAPVKAFLTHIRKEGLVRVNLAVHLRVRKGATGKNHQAIKPARVITLTPDGHRALAEELSSLKRERPGIAEDIRKAAADKDFSENAPLDAAKDHQGMVEGRIRQLEAMLHSAVVQDGEGDSTRVATGSTVTLEDPSSHEEIRYTLVYPGEASPARGKLSVESPTGKALLNRRQGDTIEVEAPAGTLHYRIARIEA